MSVPTRSETNMILDTVSSVSDGIGFREFDESLSSAGLCALWVADITAETVASTACSAALAPSAVFVLASTVESTEAFTVASEFTASAPRLSEDEPRLAG